VGVRLARSHLDAADLRARSRGIAAFAEPFSYGRLSLRRQARRIDPDVVQTRAHVFASTLMGVWLTVRIDPDHAGHLCDTVTGDVASGRKL
jgi:hypothetical protein